MVYSLSYTPGRRPVDPLLVVSLLADQLGRPQQAARDRIVHQRPSQPPRAP